MIYDKAKKGHKDKTMITKAWRNVVKECQLEDIATAQRLFANLKKRFNKRRKESKVSSGSGLADVIDAKDRLKELHFLSWLEPHVSLRENVKNLLTAFTSEYIDEIENSMTSMTF